MTGRSTRLAVLCVLAAACAHPAAAQERRLGRDDAGTGRRIALVIGNDAYPGVPLKNAVNDAVAVGAALRQIGFTVEAVTNTSAEQMARAVDQFIGRTQAGDAALFYYSGHGVQVDGLNYLIPVDFRGGDEVALKFRTINFSEIDGRLERRGARVRLLILDACRDNPFRGTRSGASGLASYTAEGALIAFATAAGQTASDNAGEVNGLFTRFFLEALKKPGLSATDVFRWVRLQVRERSGGRQVPWVHDGLIGDFVFTAPPPAAGAAARTLADTQAGCDRGVAGDCVTAGLAYAFGKGVAKDPVRAAALYQRACDGGSMPGCHNLALAYEKGEGVPMNGPLAVQLYQRACDGSAAYACENLGWMLAAGKTVTRDQARARVAYQRACDLGQLAACTRLGYMYRWAEGGSKDESRAVSLYTKACDGGDSQGCNNLGVQYQYGTGVAASAARAVALFEKACEMKNGKGCANLAEAYEKGEGVAKDAVRALSLYTRACELSDTASCDAVARLRPGGAAAPLPAALQQLSAGCDGGAAADCANLGLALAEAKGVPRDHVRARAVFQRGCDLGYLAACGNLGQLLELGLGGKRDTRQAFTLYERACNGGVFWSCGQLAAYYQNGTDGVKKDLPHAISLYEKGCSSNSAVACTNLGFAYEGGRGVPKDRARALELYRRGCQLGDENACTAARRLDR